MTNEQLVSETKMLVREELRIGLRVMENLREIEKRKLFIERGHSSLFSFCLKELGYSEPQAQLRIDAMRAIRDLPELKEKIDTGCLNVSSVARVQRHIRKSPKEFTKEEKLSLFEQVQGKSLKEVDQFLGAPKKVTLEISPELNEQLEELKALYSHRMKDSSSTAELLELLAKDALAKSDKSVAHISSKVKKPPRVSRYTDKETERKLNQDRSCSFISPVTGLRCNSTHFLQIDHIKPYSEGGTNAPENLRLLCGVHNRHVWKHRKRE